MSTLVSAEDLHAIRSRFGRKLLFVLAGLTIVVVLVVLLWPRTKRTDESAGVPLDSHVTVVGDTGTALPNRLAVLFVNGMEVGRSDPSGQLHGYLPKNVHAISDSITLREGQIQPVSFPPDAQAIAYAFPGDLGLLKYDIVGCPRLTLIKGGQFGCVVDGPAEIPQYAVWLMELLFAALFFPLLTLIAEQVMPSPRGWHRGAKLVRANIVAACLTGIAIVMLAATDAFQKAMYRLASTFEYATALVVGAICIVISAAMVIVWFRAHFQVPRTR